MNISTKPNTIFSTSWNKKKEEPMIIKSQNSKAFPMDMFLYLLIIAPIISVPPVLPYAVKTSPKPAQQRQPPIIIDMKGWSVRIGFPSNNHSKNEREVERENTPNMVFSRNLKPNIFKAIINRAMFIIE